MKKFSSQVFIFFLTLFCVSCANKDGQESRIRIVDLEGKAHKVVMRTPSLNVQALEMQGRAPQNHFTAQNEVPTPVAQKPINSADYGVVASNEMQKTLQPNSPESQAPTNQQANPTATNQKNSANSEPIKSVEYDLSKNQPEELAPAVGSKKLFLVKNSSKKNAAKGSVGKGLFVQVGSFSSLSSAKQTLAEMQKFHSGKVETIEGEKAFYRTLLGPFSSKKKALQVIAKIKNSGHEAVLMRHE